MVYLVGAGPGDPGLLTVKAHACLKKADTVVYDYLADSRILALVPEEAERIYVGKSAGTHAMKQEDISKLLVKLSREGKCVVRLKGGDPFVFGRGGEEALLLAENGLPFEIVPGVTSAIAVPAYAGIPVTHRGVAVSFAVVTGHEDPTKEASGLDWQKLATGVDTLVFLMGVGNLPAITAELMRHGRAGNTPAAVIRWGTRPEQETLITTVENAADDVARAGLKPPAIFLVGDVVRYREKLRWFDAPERRPLFGKRVLVTRARAQASKLTEGLEALGAACLEVPAIRIAEPSDGGAALRAAIAHIADYDWLIFTSANGVEHFFRALDAAGKDARALARAKVAAIGPATANALAACGVRADCVPGEYRAEAVVEALKGDVRSGTRVLLARAEEAREVLPESLKALGAEVTVAAAYCTKQAEADGAALAKKLTNGEIDIVTFTSSSTAKNLCAILGSAEPLQHVKCVAIGPITAKTCEALGIKPAAVAKEYTIEGLIETIKEMLLC